MYKDYSEMLKNYKPLYLYIDFETYEAIVKIAKASYTTKQKIVYLLIQTALKYNFCQNFQYICCETQNEKYAKRVSSGFNHKIKIYINHKLLPILEKIQLALCTATLVETVRSLVTIALEYDYNEKLIFSKPTPLNLNEYISDDGINPDFILLDII